MQDEEKLKVYNAYLRATAEASNRPWNNRGSLKGLSSEKMQDLSRVCMFFEQYSHIDPLVFFRASFSERDEKYIPLSGFLKRSAVAAYTRYISRLRGMDPESDEVVSSFARGVYFIHEFCKERGSRFMDYPLLETENGAKCFVSHLLSQKITLYNIHMFKLDMSDFPMDYMGLVMSDFESEYTRTRTNYLCSTRMREIGEKVVRKFFVEQP